MPCTPLNIFSNISVCPCSAARCLDDEAIDEKGVDSSEEIDFNVVPIMHEEEIGNFDEFDKNFVPTNEEISLRYPSLLRPPQIFGPTPSCVDVWKIEKD